MQINYQFNAVTTFNYLRATLGRTPKHRLKERIQVYQASIWKKQNGI